MDPVVARQTWRTLEPIHGTVYFAPEAAARYEALGLRGRSGYFASRSAPMGAASPELVTATFFNFDPALVRRSMADVWSTTTPAAVLDARFAAVDEALARAFGDLDVGRAAELARRAAETAAEHLVGRPLFAGHASLAWPAEPRLVLWHAQTLLREYRGDGHTAALVTHGFSGLDALVTHAATGDVPAATLQASRGWGDEAWATAVDRLRSLGVLEADGLALTDAGRELRQDVEDHTDAAALPAYEALGEEGCAELRRAARPLSQAVIAAGLLPV